MIGKHFPKVSQPSRQSPKSYNPKFGMDECTRNSYGATLTEPTILAVDFENPRLRKEGVIVCIIYSVEESDPRLLTD